MKSIAQGEEKSDLHAVQGRKCLITHTKGLRRIRISRKSSVAVTRAPRNRESGMGYSTRNLTYSNSNQKVVSEVEVAMTSFQAVQLRV